MEIPVLYSLRHCPYAMRARLAIYKSNQAVAMRDVVLTNKPAQMIEASAKATVPILVIDSSMVIDESLELMLWVLGRSDPQNLLRADHSTAENQRVGQAFDDILSLINIFDNEFKACLNDYKCAKRYHESNINECRQACEVYIQDLEQRLLAHKFLIDNKESMADIAILPFIRQFAKVERHWYLQSQYVALKRWLNEYLQSRAFSKIMTKYPLWSPGQPIVKFGRVS